MGKELEKLPLIGPTQLDSYISGGERRKGVNGGLSVNKGSQDQEEVNSNAVSTHLTSSENSSSKVEEPFVGEIHTVGSSTHTPLEIRQDP